jgi:transcriptional regulator with XRE-family HTH domain
MTSEELAAYMARHDLTDAALADLLGVTRQSVHGWRTGRNINRITILALERLETIMTTATIDTIEDIFANLDNPRDHLQGFVGWVFEQREETLSSLRESAYDDLAFEVDYFIRRVVFKGEGHPKGVEGATVEYLEHYRGKLIDALEESLDED